jgi:hypothetical protein
MDDQDNTVVPYVVYDVATGVIRQHGVSGRTALAYLAASLPEGLAVLEAQGDFRLHRVDIAAGPPRVVAKEAQNG